MYLYIYTYDLSFFSYPKAVYIQIGVFSFQETPSALIIPKELWLENCNLNERFAWLNHQEVEPLWLQEEDVPGFQDVRMEDEARTIVNWC